MTDLEVLIHEYGVAVLCEGKENLPRQIKRILEAARATPADHSQTTIPGSPGYALRGLYKMADKYFIDGKPCTPDEYITWQSGIIEAITKSKVPDPKYYGGSAEEGGQHDVKCAYVDGWNDCRGSILAIHQATPADDARPIPYLPDFPPQDYYAADKAFWDATSMRKFAHAYADLCTRIAHEDRNRDATIEECATECDRVANQAAKFSLGPQQDCASSLADNIRALKSQQDAAIESQRSEGE